MKTLSAICLFIYHWPSILESPVREIVDSTSEDASLNLENIADTDEFLDDVLQEADFMEGIRPLDISVDDEKSENVDISYQSSVEILCNKIPTEKINIKHVI